MENCRKTLLILTPFYLLFLLHHLAVATDSPSPYPLAKNIFLACGWSGNKSFNGRTWFGDVNSEYSPLEPQENSSKIFPNSQETPYSASRLSRSEFSYTFNPTSGQKFIRLHFYSASYPGFNNPNAFFSVKAGSFTLLRNFSASLTAEEWGQNTFFKEFCMNIEEHHRLLNITFIPSPDYQDSYAFISGIEIVSMPPNLYYTSDDDPGLSFVDQENQYSISKSHALENLYRINVGGKFISPQQDTGMYRTWRMDGDYLTDARPSALPVNSSIVLSFRAVANYSAPVAVYQTARTMGQDKKINENYNLTWEFEVDSGFTYFLRLHFCEFQIELTKAGDRVFDIYIADLMAEPRADIMSWSGGNGVPIYTDYAVMMGSKEGNGKKQNLSIKLHPAPQRRTLYSDAILNGLEIFKVDNGGSLFDPDPRILSPPSIEMSSSQSKKSKKRATIVAIVGGLVSGFVVISLLFLFLRPKFSTSKTKPRKSRGSSLTSDLCTHFSLSQIKAATNNFDDALIIGIGGFGNVYKGFISGGTTPVAIKRLNPGSEQGALEFETEIRMLSQLIHIHLVTLIGYCDDDGEMILVYDFMARGTVRDHLYNSCNPPLPLNQRLQICIGAARALHYLHSGAKQVVVHRDVKTTNILLDEKWVAKVSDFGLSKFGPNSMSKTHISTVVKGSIGYLDPEYYRRQQLTEKSDVYSFGVVLMEVLCARPPILRTVDEDQVSLAIWAQQCYRIGTIAEIIDPYLKDKITPECLNKFAEVAISCLNDDGSRRPSMGDVVRGLEFAFQLQESTEENQKLVEVELSTIRSDSRSLCLDVFTEIMSPQGR